jgi:uroporphyrinogen-III synthase
LLRSRGHEVLELPLLRIESIADAELGAGPWAAVLFTSANAIRAIANHRRFAEIATLQAYVVGQRTQAEAVAAGFASVMSAEGDVDDLARLIATKPPVGDLPLINASLRRDGATNFLLPGGAGVARGGTTSPQPPDPP